MKTDDFSVTEEVFTKFYAQFHKPDGNKCFRTYFKLTEHQNITFLWKQLDGYDLTGVNFSYINLAGLSLSNTNFTNANLIKTNFTWTNLCGAIFTNAAIIGAVFAGAALINTEGFPDDKLYEFAKHHGAVISKTALLEYIDQVDPCAMQIKYGLAKIALQCAASEPNPELKQSCIDTFTNCINQIYILQPDKQPVAYKQDIKNIEAFHEQVTLLLMAHNYDSGSPFHKDNILNDILGIVVNALIKNYNISPHFTNSWCGKINGERQIKQNTITLNG